MTDTRMSEEREAFEAWLTETFGSSAVLDRYPDDDPDGLAGEYVDGLARDCWAAWQARAERETQGGEMREFISDYVETWRKAHPGGECHRPNACLVCRGRRILSQAGEKATSKPEGDRND